MSDYTRPVRIAIVGTGFAGVYAYLEFHKRFHGKNLEITLIGETDSFVFIPMIHEVATGTLTPGSVIQPMRTIPQCCLKCFIEGRVTAVDCDRRIIFVQHEHLVAAEGDAPAPARVHREVEYDYLVLAMGSETNYYDVSGAKTHSFDLKNLHDAKRIKNHIIESYEDAELEAEPARQREILRFIIVGGGPTGVEIAGELADMVSGELTNAFPKLRGMASVFLLEQGESLLTGGVDPWFAHRASSILEKKQEVYVLYNSAVREVTPEGVRTDHGMMRAGTVIWAAGVMARSITTIAKKDVPREERTGRIKVNEYLQIANYPNVFVAGDQAFVESEEEGHVYPMRAIFAVQQGKVAAANLSAMVYQNTPQRFHYRDSGFILSLGNHGALARLAGIHVSGFLAWLVYRLAYIDKAVGWRAKLHLFIEWGLNIFVPRDISKL